MKISFSLIDDVNHIKMLTSNATYGVGFFTAISLWFCNIFGIQCEMYDKKIEMAKNTAIETMVMKATKLGATGIMDVKFQISGTTVFVYGIAYK